MSCLDATTYPSVKNYYKTSKPFLLWVKKYCKKKLVNIVDYKKSCTFAN